MTEPKGVILRAVEMMKNHWGEGDSITEEGYFAFAEKLASANLLAVPGEPCEHLQPQPADPFMQDLTELLRRHGKQAGSDAAHFVLAQYLVHSLEAFDYATRYARSVAAIQQNNAGEAS